MQYKDEQMKAAEIMHAWSVARDLHQTGCWEMLSRIETGGQLVHTEIWNPQQMLPDVEHQMRMIWSCDFASPSMTICPQTHQPFLSTTQLLAGSWRDAPGVV